MITISVDDIQRDFAQYLHRVEAGETLLLTLSDRPIAEIKPVMSQALPFSSELRPFGLCAGEFIVPDDFDAPLSEDVLRQFEGHSDIAL